MKNRHPRPARNFEVVAGKVMDSRQQATRFAFVRGSPSTAATAVERLFVDTKQVPIRA